MPATQKTFKGYAVTDAEKWTDFSVVEFPSKNWEETDVEISTTHCGVCGSDVHTVSSGWGPIPTPMIVGHEIVGTVVRVGSKVKSGIKVGDRVGVGAQAGSCYECKCCKSGFENYCLKPVYTYNSVYPDGVRSQGGYSTGIIANEQFVFPIPDSVASADAASMLCGGLTVYSPLLHHGAGPGKKVGVLGIGGLGHYAILFAKAMGCEVYAFSHSASKKEDAKKMGADHFIETADPKFHQNYAQELDLIISTRNVADEFPLTEFLSMLNPFGKFILVGVPETPLPAIHAFSLIQGGRFLGGSAIGSKLDAISMFKLVAEKNIKPWIEVLPMKEVKKAVDGVWTGKPRYRYVLEQDITA
ncbi:NADPH-dependent alcohol dehydrogenase [Pyrrhoderma noxium]|uniref:alcohol dehydrogenase (NADP(+)) n=1 Tax=Pyrrhoderma noxium TaxID=2282107 RepID=A0A286U5I5_9AGAM|nr:NADPH-dependent alcohol dehydrogenase [Pyrrhoderma noxium]